MSNVYLDKLRSISGKPTVREPTKPTKGAYVGFVGAATTRIPENGAANEPHDLDEAQAERAAIREFDAGIPRDVAELLARHGDASAGGVDWTLHRLVTDVQSSRRWLVVTSLGCTTLTITAPTTRAEVMKSLRYSAALPIGDAP